MPSAETIKTIVATIASCLGLYWGYRRFLLKEGVRIRGNWVTASSIQCEGSFVSRVILENCKDRAVTIYDIFLQLDHGYFIKIEGFEGSPLILKGFETYQKDFDPIDFYSINACKVDIEPIMRDVSVTKRLVLSTSHGRYVVRKRIKRWDPNYLYFSNHYAGVVHTKRATYKGKGYGGNVAYFVHFHSDDGTENIVPIYPSDFQIQKFRGFQLTEESLKSKSALIDHLTNCASEGTLRSIKFEVYSVAEMKDDDSWFYREGTLPLAKIGLFRFHVLGRYYTWLSGRRMKKENRKLARQAILNRSKNLETVAHSDSLAAKKDEHGADGNPH
jgi:hypothetical protein